MTAGIPSCSTESWRHGGLYKDAKHVSLLSSCCFAFVFQGEASANWTLNTEDVDPVCCQRGTCPCDCEHRAEEATESVLCMSRNEESQRCLHH
ncbi:hypothetical protein Q8A73_009682 [Channa argus]|nr:hypothetical protein Q8A73_009682 [Channa argus]